MLSLFVIIMITLTMIIGKLIDSTCRSWHLDWHVLKGNEVAEEKSTCSFRVLGSDHTKCMQIQERQENCTSFFCSNKCRLCCASLL